jgi:4-amino-4-deoxy-L-arabinose transferase-like glycosyltransferase
MIPTTRRFPPSKAEPLTLIALVLVAVSMLIYFWAGYLGSDDQVYATAALDWLHHFPALGKDVWELRYVPVLPIAVTFGLLGPSTFALALPNAVVFGVFLLAQYAFLRSAFGWRAAAIGCLVLIMLPAFFELSTYANPDMPEAAAVITSFWIFARLDRTGRPVLLAVVAGIFAGLAFLARETMLALLLTYLALFLFRPLVPRSRYLAMGLGFFLVVAPQFVYFAAYTGNPLYRQAISAQIQTAAVDRAGNVTEAQAQGNAFDAEGVLAVNPMIAPFTAVLVSPKFGLLFLLGIPAAIWLIRGGGGLDARQRRDVTLFGLLALICFLFVALNARVLLLVPRYFTTSAVAVSVPLAVAADRLFVLRPRLAWLGAAAYLGSCLALLSLLNRAPLWPEQTLVALAARPGEFVFTDPRTADRAGFLLLLRGLDGRVKDTPPPPGALFLGREGIVDFCLRRLLCQWKGRAEAYRVRPTWQELERFPAPRRMAGDVVHLAGLDRHLPPDVVRKLSNPSDDIVLYRLPR